MYWPFNRAQRAPEKWIAPHLKFIGEQDGPPERQLKDDVAVILATCPAVQRAYLARVVFDDSQSIDVVLAIRTNSGPDDELLQAIGERFAKTFRSDVHLDVLFLTCDQEKEASEVCRPFYTRK